MAVATFRHGEALMVDYTPGSAVDAGDVIVVGAYTFVAHSDIASGALGALAAGCGVYKMTADGNLTPGAKVYWDSSTEKITVTTDSGANKHFGYLPPSSDPASDGDLCDVVHDPDGSSI